MTSPTAPPRAHRIHLSVVALDLALAVLGMLLLLGACAVFAIPAYGRAAVSTGWLATGIAGPAIALPVAGLALLRGRWRQALGWHALAVAIPALMAAGTALSGHGGPATWFVALACAVPFGLLLLVPGARRTPRTVNA